MSTDQSKRVKVRWIPFLKDLLPLRFEVIVLNNLQIYLLFVPKFSDFLYSDIVVIALVLIVCVQYKFEGLNLFYIILIPVR